MDRPLETASPGASTSQGPASEPKLLFMVGMWRSGTSLLYALLNQHPRIALMYEAEPMDLWPWRKAWLAGGNWPRRLEFFNQTLSRHRLDGEKLAATRPGRDAALSLYRQYALGREAQVEGEKAPAYYGRLAMLGRLFPQARFVIVWRDPLACCSSAARAGKKNRFFAQRGMMTRILFGSELMARGVESLRRQQRLVHEVVYEDLLKDPEKELRQVCNFLGIAFAPEMLALRSADLSPLPPGEHHSGVRSGVIGKQAPGQDSLPADFACKALRYSVLWRQRFSNLGFARALPAGGNTTAPGMAERLADGAAVLYWRTLDRAKRVLFRHIPLPWWGRLRSGLPAARPPAKAAL